MNSRAFPSLSARAGISTFMMSGCGLLRLLGDGPGMGHMCAQFSAIVPCCFLVPHLVMFCTSRQIGDILRAIEGRLLIQGHNYRNQWDKLKNEEEKKTTAKIKQAEQIFFDRLCVAFLRVVVAWLSRGTSSRPQPVPSTTTAFNFLFFGRLLD